MTPGPVKTGDRVSVGVSGYISSIPKAYEQEAVLTGRPGIVSAYSSWGQVMQASGGSVKLSLEDDEYNRVVHCKTAATTCDLPQLVLKPALKTPPPGSDMMDNGGYYCFCNLYGGCEAAAKVPMHVTIDLLQKYAPPPPALLRRC